MDKQADAPSDPIVYDFSNTSGLWPSEEAAEQTTSFLPFQRAETPPEYRDESVEDKLTDLEEMVSTNENEGTPQIQSDTDVHGGSSNELTDNPLGIQELSSGTSDYSPGENKSANSPVASQMLELTDNPIDAQEWNPQLKAEPDNTEESIDYSPGENKSANNPVASQMLELTDNPIDAQEWSSQLKAEPDNTAENSDYSPGENTPTYPADTPVASQVLELTDNILDAQKISPQLSVEPDITAENSDYSPGENTPTYPADSPVASQVLELTDNILDAQKISPQLSVEPDITAENSDYSPGENTPTYPADSPVASQVLELTDNTLDAQKFSPQLSAEPDITTENSDYSQGEHTPTYPADILDPSQSHPFDDNHSEVQECSQQLSEFPKDDLTQNYQDSSRNLVAPNNELCDNAPGIQECAQRLDQLLDNSSVTQECTQKLSVIPDEPANESQLTPQIHDSPNNTANAQECSDKLIEKSSPQGLSLDSRDEPMEDIQPDQAKEQHSDVEMHPAEIQASEHVVRDQFDSETLVSQTQNGSSQPTHVERVTSELMDQQTTGLSKHIEVEIIEPITVAPQQQQQQQQQIKKESSQTRIKSTTEPLLSHPPLVVPTAIMQDQMTNEEYRCWKDVLEHPQEFDTWVKLLALSEKHENIVVIREIFDRFLKLYPYCYGYWRKFSDLVLRLQGWSTAQQILEIAVYSIPLSIDLWLHYAILSINQGLDYATITGLYDRSLEIAGYEYRSDLLWEAAIQYQESQQQTVKVFTLLRQLIATPTLHYKRHFTMYETFLSTRPILELLSAGEFKSIGEQIKHTQPANETGQGLEERVRDSLLDQGTQVHAATEEEIGLRQPFEEKIKRPYFHVQPLEEAQLQTWRSYLDFEISRKYKDRIVFLFERCMIVCALYEEMWIKYAKYLGFEYSLEARAVFQRGTCYIPNSVPIHLEWSYFEENIGQLESARELLQSIDKEVPGLIEIESHYISFELRHGNKDRVDEQYKLVLQHSLKQYQKNSQAENKRMLHDTYNYWVAKYAFFLSRHRNEHAVAKKLLADAIEKDKNNPTLYFHLVDLEFHHQPLDKDKVMSVLNKGIHAPVPQEVKEIFSLRKLNWAQAMGIQLDYRVMNDLKTLYDKSIKQVAYQQSSHAMRKRPSDYESDIYAKQSRLDPSVYAGEQAQYPMNYAQNQQTYSQYYSTPTATNHYQYQASGQRGEMGNAGNQQWGQQYYQQDWAYQHQYQHQ